MPFKAWLTALTGRPEASALELGARLIRVRERAIVRSAATRSWCARIGGREEVYVYVVR
jgi:hypothetical protein